MTPIDASQRNRDMVASINVIPVLTIDDSHIALDLAHALLSGGLNVIEITLRTPQALPAIYDMAKIKDICVGAGTILTANDVDKAITAGASFGVSPGATIEVLDRAEEKGLPILPGVATASEMMAMLARGYDFVKFFPAETLGGMAALKSYGAPFGGLSFCPTGGIDQALAIEYLKLKNVLCVGGSWLVPKQAIEQKNWSKISELALATTKFNTK